MGWIGLDEETCEGMRLLVRGPRMAGLTDNEESCSPEERRCVYPSVLRLPRGM
jgi:hypothetical protein